MIINTIEICRGLEIYNYRYIQQVTAVCMVTKTFFTNTQEVQKLKITEVH